MSYSQWKPDYYDLSTREIAVEDVEGYWWNTFWDPRRPLKPFLAMLMLDVYLFIYFFLKVKIICSTQYRSKSLEAWFGGIFDWVWLWVKIQLCSQREGVLGTKNCKNCSLLSQSKDNRKLYNISKNQFLRPIRKRGEIRVSHSLTLKKCCSSLVFPANWARLLHFGM